MSELSWFNEQILKCQDDAYTLAWYLLGDERAAEEAVQAALVSIFKHRGTKVTDCHQHILRAVLIQCQRQARRSLPMTGLAANDGYGELLRRLPDREKQTLVLVDIIGLSYEEAAVVTDLPVKIFRQRLAQARHTLAASHQAQPI